MSVFRKCKAFYLEVCGHVAYHGKKIVRRIIMQYFNVSDSQLIAHISLLTAAVLNHTKRKRSGSSLRISPINVAGLCVVAEIIE